MTRLVIKLGSSSIASGDGLALDVIADLVTQIATAQREGHEVILVTSGAARLGRRLLAFEGPTARTGPELLRLAGAVRQTVSEAGDLGALAATLDRYNGGELSGPLAVARRGCRPARFAGVVCPAGRGRRDGGLPDPAVPQRP